MGQHILGKQMGELATPTGETMLLKARRAIANKQTPDAVQLVAEFHRHFVVTTPVRAPQVFERFSLADSTVRTVIQANTTRA